VLENHSSPMCTKLPAGTTLDRNWVFLSVRTAQQLSLLKRHTSPRAWHSWVSNWPCQWSPRRHSGNHFFPSVLPSFYLPCLVFQGWNLFSTTDSPSPHRVAAIQTSLRWCLNTQNKHAGKGATGCLGFPRYDQVSRFFLSTWWAEPWSKVLL